MNIHKNQIQEGQSAEVFIPGIPLTTNKHIDFGHYTCMHVRPIESKGLLDFSTKITAIS